jgi:hypothetical protein
MVVHSASLIEEEQTTFQPADVVLAIEVVSVESQDEKVDRQPTAYVYELDPTTRAYALTGIHHGFLKLTVPFDIEIDLAEYNNL